MLENAVDSNGQNIDETEIKPLEYYLSKIEEDFIEGDSLTPKETPIKVKIEEKNEMSEEEETAATDNKELLPAIDTLPKSNLNSLLRMPATTEAEQGRQPGSFVLLKSKKADPKISSP